MLGNSGDNVPISLISILFEKSIGEDSIDLRVIGDRPRLIWRADHTRKNNRGLSPILLRVRSAPTLNSDVINQLNRGDVVEIQKTEGDWSFVTVGSLKGWVSNTYLSTK